jgi:hypothetical protein
MTAIKLGRRPLRGVKYTGRYSGVLAHIAEYLLVPSHIRAGFRRPEQPAMVARWPAACRDRFSLCRSAAAVWRLGHS